MSVVECSRDVGRGSGVQKVSRYGSQKVLWVYRMVIDPDICTEMLTRSRELLTSIYI